MSPEPKEIGLGVFGLEREIHDLRNHLCASITSIFGDGITSRFSFVGFIWEPKDQVLHPVISIDPESNKLLYAMGDTGFQDRYPLTQFPNHRIQVNWNNNAPPKIYTKTREIFRDQAEEGYVGDFIQFTTRVDPFAPDAKVNINKLISILTQRNLREAHPSDEIEELKYEKWLLSLIESGLSNASRKR